MPTVEQFRQDPMDFCDPDTGQDVDAMLTHIKRLASITSALDREIASEDDVWALMTAIQRTADSINRVLYGSDTSIGGES